MEYAEIDSRINTLLEEMKNEVLHAAFLTNNYDIATHQLIHLGPVKNEDAVRAVPHTIKAAQVAKKLEKVCLQYKLKYGNTDHIDSILNDIGEVYNMRQKAKEWFAQYKSKAQTL